MEQVVSQIAGQAEQGRPGIRGSELTEADFDKRKWQGFGGSLPGGPQYRLERQLEAHVGNYRVVQLVSKAEGLLLIVAMVTWSKGEQQDWHIDWHERPRRFEHRDIRSQSLPLVSQEQASLVVEGILSVRVS